MQLGTKDLVNLKLLKFSPFERRPRGGWRFGARSITDAAVARLIASGRARIEGQQIVAAGAPRPVPPRRRGRPRKAKGSPS